MVWTYQKHKKQDANCKSLHAKKYFWHAWIKDYRTDAVFVSLLEVTRGWGWMGVVNFDTDGARHTWIIATGIDIQGPVCGVVYPKKGPPKKT